jgi:dipeptidyl-peptidase-4
MLRARLLLSVAAVVGLLLSTSPSGAPQPATAPTIEQFLGAASPLEVVAAAKTDRIAWVSYERGQRNVYTAAGPAFAPVKLTNYPNDDGVDLTDVTISADGSTVAFVRGSAANRDGWHANPSGDPGGGEQAIWAAHVATPGTSWRVTAGANPILSPDGRFVLQTRNGQIHRVRVSATPANTAMDRGEAPFISTFGTNSGPVFSPDGSKIAFVSNRVNHGFIGVYDVAARTVKYIAPSVDFDSNPMWTADSKRIVFVRRPGTPFGQQSHAGAGGLGLPAGPAYQPSQGAQGGRGGAGSIPPSALSIPGMMVATFKGGHTYSIWTADAATGTAAETWHPVAGDRFQSLPALQLAGEYVVFSGNTGGGRGGGGRGGQGSTAPEEWERFYSLRYTDAAAKPVQIITTDGIIEDATSWIISQDGSTFYYCTNANDIDRRHIWAVPVAGGTPRQVTTGTGIETYPAPLASGKGIATLSASWNMPQSIGIWSPTGSGQTAPLSQRIVFPTTRPGFPTAAHVEPENVITQPADKAFEIHNQLFLPRDIKPGEKRPAMVFVHGGPVRQMLLGYHYRYVYHQFYAVNQWLASKGYVVLSVNFRSGVGYGNSFRRAANVAPNGIAELQDVVAGAKYLQSRPDVDPSRIGIYGLSYGGLLTAQALARHSDIFAAGVDYAGVHLYGSSLDPESNTYKASAISQIDNWKSPVLIVHGDDDRNVTFAQTVGLVQLLRQRDIYHEVIVQPDDVHDSLRHDRWIEWLERMDTFLQKFLGGNQK